ncbi:MAG: hypothetical protein KKG33_08375 [candidate division Zixibacteria bacterium]|nr:hypothetical protein [candidate division Zixibacteria bacterium]MBU2625561.1 hypothetical protein [candidate division Zixibacteria bacterium]
MIVADYITPIKKIYKSSRADRRRQEIAEILSDSKTILRKHLGKNATLDEVVDFLMLPGTVRRLANFNLKHWMKTGHRISRDLKNVLGQVPEPSILLYPGMQRVNGKIIHLDNKPVISLSPDFGYFGGDNLTLALAHEYTHYLRARIAGVRFEKMPVYRHLVEEGLAVYVSTLVMPDVPLSTIFMSNLHSVIGRPDPKGGYVRWCWMNMPRLTADALKVLKSREHKPVGRFFEGMRVFGEHSSIRTGYYIGLRMIEQVVEEIPLRKLLAQKPTAKQVQGWLEKMST